MVETRGESRAALFPCSLELILAVGPWVKAVPQCFHL